MPFVAQEKVLKQITSDLVMTEYGQYHQLNCSADYEKYCQHIPIVNYEDIAPWIDKSKTKKNIITKENIDFYEYTSGSISNKKSIPYTKQLRNNFSNCFKIWGFDCLDNGLKLNSMKMFMSISPHISYEEGSVNIRDDSDYIKGLLQFLIRPFLVTQSNIYQLRNPDDFRFILALTLLAHENIEIISIWSPSYLLILLKIIAERSHEMLFYIKKKNFKYQNVNFVVPYLTKKRKAILESLHGNVNFNTLWPDLKIISCWCSGTSQRSAEILSQYFKHTIMIQGKGLLATEAPITIPLLKAKGYVPLIDDIFFEFEDKNKNILRVHELKNDEVYEIIISQRSGLYRYRMGDSVRVTHFYQNTPCLEFIGRTNQTSDLVGEKLNESFVAKIFKQAPFQHSHSLLLVPTMQSTGQGKYYLLTDNANIVNQETRLDLLLSESFHYRNARKMLQLLCPEILFHSQVKTILYREMESLGVKMGDQKESSLILSSTIGEKLVRSIEENRG